MNKNSLTGHLLILPLICLFISFIGCWMDDGDDCTSDFGEVIVENITHDPYQFLINDSLMATLESQDTLVFRLKSGYYNFKMIQVSGYVTTPRIFENKSYAVDPCTASWFGAYNIPPA